MSPAEFVLAIALYTCSNGNTLVREKHMGSMAKIHYKTVYQPVRLLISARAYQPVNIVFLSRQTSISRAYQPRNQPANRLNNFKTGQIWMYDRPSVFCTYMYLICIMCSASLIITAILGTIVEGPLK